MVSGKISPLWFATALMTVVVFRCPLRDLPLLLLCCVIGTAFANALVIGPAFSNIKFVLLNLLQALTGGFLLRLLLDRRAPLNSMLDWARFIGSVGIITPLIGGAVATLLLHTGDKVSYSFFYMWVISEVIGMLALGPVLLLLPWPHRRLNLSELRITETLFTLALTLTASYLALRFMPWPFTFIVVILFWCAVRLPKLEAFILFFLNACFISTLLAFDLISVSRSNSTFGQISSWLPFLLVLIPSHVMSLIMDAFQREKIISVKAKRAFVMLWSILQSVWRWCHHKVPGFRSTIRCVRRLATRKMNSNASPFSRLRILTTSIMT